MLRDGRDAELEQAKQDAPEDFVRWVSAIQDGLKAHANGLWGESLKSLESYGDWQSCAKDPAKRKQFAEYAKSQGVITPLLFAHLDRKPVWPLLWKMVCPSRNVQTYKVDVDV